MNKNTASAPLFWSRSSVAVSEKREKLRVCEFLLVFPVSSDTSITPHSPLIYCIMWTLKREFKGLLNQVSGLSWS